MQLQPIKPEVERFIDEQVQTGRFSSREAVVEAAVERMMDEREEFALDDEDVAAIIESEEQIDRGEFVEFETFAAEMRKKYSRP
jgi:Arc/MetJ-type ribon-helix-helix transcriptional regulator